jgi:glutaredoxin 3
MPTTKSITIYTTPTCAFCHMAKEYLKVHNFPFSEKDAAADQSIAQELYDKSGQLGVPVIDIDGEIIVGFDRPRIDKALGL